MGRAVVEPRREADVGWCSRHQRTEGDSSERKWSNQIPPITGFSSQPTHSHSFPFLWTGQPPPAMTFKSCQRKDWSLSGCCCCQLIGHDPHHLRIFGSNFPQKSADLIFGSNFFPPKSSDPYNEDFSAWTLCDRLFISSFSSYRYEHPWDRHGGLSHL